MWIHIPDASAPDCTDPPGIIGYADTIAAVNTASGIAAASPIARRGVVRETIRRLGGAAHVGLVMSVSLSRGSMEFAARGTRTDSARPLVGGGSFAPSALKADSTPHEPC